MRKLFVLVLATVFASSLAIAAEVKTITGEGKCAKCALKETPSCQNVIEVEEGGATVKYYLAKNKASNDFHKSGGICTATVKTTATGEVTEKDGKKTLTATEVKKAD